MTDSVQGRGWNAQIEGADATVVLSGNWIARENGIEPGASQKILKTGARAVKFDAHELGTWDSGLIAFLSSIRDAANDDGVAFDEAGLPVPARRLLALVAKPAAEPAQPPKTPLLDRVGRWAISIYAELTEVAALIGETCLGAIAAVRGRAGMRRSDLLNCLQEAGASALPIVTVVNLLVGGILAFVGAVQLRQWGADKYVADLVGISVVREMAALMTAIIMSGRTGGAYAAHIATMQGNEEIDALRVVGIPVFGYLILPRVLGLTAMMPILYLYGCAVGILGGLVVSFSVMGLSPTSFIDELQLSVSGSQFGIGLSKSVAFGVLIAIAGCRVGLRAGRSAADVGQAATTAVVVSIVGVIALDAVFAVCANALGI